MKVALIGAGGFRTPLMYKSLAASAQRLGIESVALHDIDGPRLSRIETVILALADEEQLDLPYARETSLRGALEGADFVLCAIRVGGMESRVVDETVPLAEGIIGQETTGPGGIGFALRTIPVIRAIAEEAAAVAPRSWFINFTNPAGLVTEALTPILGQRVVGICDGPPMMFAGVASALGANAEELSFDYFGLNHLGWLKGVSDASGDRLPELLADDARIAELEEGRLFGSSFVKALGMIPNAYLYYYYAAPQALAGFAAGGRTRAEQILAAQAPFYDGEASEPPEATLRTWRRILSDREITYMSESRNGKAQDESHRARKVALANAAGGYAGVALDVIEGLSQTTPKIMVLNTQNRGSLSFLDSEAIVEVPCAVSSTGIRPLATHGVPLHARGLIEILKQVERTTVEAAVERSPALAIHALALHPLVPSREAAERIFEHYRDRQPLLRETFAGAAI